ncbi:hypothetical protein SLEP1_g44246 [Rubroshorea leprosula]|uniref:Uncharacterized protein n=1 Tax=Rubroshorea leprosula TaxID=152421 RepID=A0AAV5LFK6_9ROSI|nr:hypothetical protein SLEP1_g44246 [Rubroshorea leprosula]
MKKLKKEMEEIGEEQKQIREGQRQVREKFEAMEEECKQLREETRQITMQRQILKARENNDLVRATELTRFLRSSNKIIVHPSLEDLKREGEPKLGVLALHCYLPSFLPDLLAFFFHRLKFSPNLPLPLPYLFLLLTYGKAADKSVT